MHRIPKPLAVGLLASVALSAACSTGTTQPELYQTGHEPRGHDAKDQRLRS